MSIFRSYNDILSVPMSVTEGEVSRTKQEFAKDSDINHILEQWNSTGYLKDPNMSTPMYGDFTMAVDYQEAFAAVTLAQEHFRQLPSKVRARVGHDPAELMRFLADPENDLEAIDLGLKIAPEVAVQADPPEAAPSGGPEGDPPQSS